MAEIIGELDPDNPHQDAHMILRERPPIPEQVDEFIFVARRFSGTIHVLQDVDQGKLACGRKMSLSLQEVACVDIDASTAPFCMHAVQSSLQEVACVDIDASTAPFCMHAVQSSH